MAQDNQSAQDTWVDIEALNGVFDSPGSEMDKANRVVLKADVQGVTDEKGQIVFGGDKTNTRASMGKDGEPDVTEVKLSFVRQVVERGLLEPSSEIGGNYLETIQSNADELLRLA